MSIPCAYTFRLPGMRLATFIDFFIQGRYSRKYSNVLGDNSNPINVHLQFPVFKIRIQEWFAESPLLFFAYCGYGGLQLYL